MHIYPISDRVIIVVEGAGHAFLRTVNRSVDTKPNRTR